MNSLPIRMFRVCRAELLKNVKARVKASGLVLLAMFALCGMSASAQVTLSNNGPLTLKSGTFGGFNLVATPVGNYSGSFVIACSKLPQYAYCIYPNLNQGVTVSSGTATTTRIVVNTSQVAQYETASNDKAHRAARVALGVLLAPSALLLLVFRKRSRKGLGALQGLLALVMMVSLGGLAGCGSTMPLNTPTGTYSFTISAAQYANATAFASTNVTLIVN